MRLNNIYICLLVIALCFFSFDAFAQRDILRDIPNRIPNIGQGAGSGGNDSLRHRTYAEDSITVRIYYLDSTGVYRLDSSITDYTRFPIPPTHVYLGNTGAPARSILFSPRTDVGWDPGFHTLDIYKWTIDRVRFFNSTKPYTELGYMLATRAEQIIEILHTQNIRPTWNASFQYRLINSPGFFRNQKTNHNNYLFTSWYQAPSKRYNNYFVVLANNLQAGESGGIKTDKNYLDDPVYGKDRYTIPVKIGGQPAYVTNFFNSTLYTGNRYKEFTVLMRQQYDFGRKDSLVTDSTVIPLFYPRLRMEHTFRYGNNSYMFQDVPVSSSAQFSNGADTVFYNTNYNLNLHSDTSLTFRDNWKEINNDFSIYQYPDVNNLRQYIKIGLESQILFGDFVNKGISKTFYNVIGHGEYRNKSKNQKWDILGFGRLYLGGFNIGDYHAFISLQRLLSQRFGSFQVGFENVNQSPSFIYNDRSSFYLDLPTRSFNKENITHLFASILEPKLQARLSADYYLIGNYLYVTDFYKLQQEATLFNVLRINALKTFKVGRHWNWHAEVYVQQKTGTAQLNLPLLYTRNRFAYEGNLGFKSLNIAIGTELRYHTPYKADNYSPVLGQFFYQNRSSINNLPEIDAYLQLRIRGFRAFFRVENLNTARYQGGLYFNNNNLAAPDYPMPGLVTRLGIYWSFVN